jgi:uncharacterized protein (DUF1810 family)
VSDPFNLQRFVEAQQDVYETVLAELRAGAKRSHWMWFIFPQQKGLGRSAMAEFYGLSDTEEAAAYAAHPLLGVRLRECAMALLTHLASRSPEQILGSVDALKLRSSMRLFAEAVPDEPLFAEVLAAAS